MFLSGVGKFAMKAANYSKASGSRLDFTSPQAQRYMGPFEESMTRREACLILSLKNSAKDEEIMAAHRKLMLLNHPDNGGSTYLAMKCNQAKDKLLLK
jgi:DnaJ-domain-containing protein 1